MINTNNLNEARKQIQKLKKEGKEVIVLAQNDDFNRKIFENKEVSMIVGLEFDGKDRLKQRDSGLNEVLCKLAKSNDVYTDTEPDEAINSRLWLEDNKADKWELFQTYFRMPNYNQTLFLLRAESREGEKSLWDDVEDTVDQLPKW